MEVFIQLTGILGIVMNIISFQCQTHKKILFYRTLNEFLFAIQYFFLGIYSGVLANLCVCLRNLIFSRCVQKNKSTQIPIVVFCCLFLILGLSTWDGFSSIMIIFVKFLSTLAYGNKNPRILRMITLAASTGWLTFNIIVQSYAGIVCEVISLSAILIGILRLDYPLIKQKVSFFTSTSRR
ncbi:YgjV family protein [Holdemania massiliensis]|uniref:YgjV family protein n=1 Tax=Holdemania massiliensis TaxID=1468449 RepID=UPI003521E9D0